MNRVILIRARLFCCILLFFLTSNARAIEFNELQLPLADGSTLALSAGQGKVLLFVNFTLNCGTTEQLRDVQSLYVKYSREDLQVIALPTYEFASSSPPTGEEMHAVCTEKYGTTYPISVPVGATSPIVTFLTNSSDEDLAGPMSFNFEKFLVGRDGRIRYRFGPFTSVKSRKFLSALDELLREEVA